MTMNEKIIYLDANFLVDLSVRKEPELKKRARILFAEILKNFDILAFSPLTIDETWKAIKLEISQKHSSYAEYPIFSELERFTENVLNYKKMRIIQFKNPAEGVRGAMVALRSYSMMPRDAFHLSLMRDNEISAIATRDDKFIKRQNEMGISVSN